MGGDQKVYFSETRKFSWAETKKFPGLIGKDLAEDKPSKIYYIIYHRTGESSIHKYIYVCTLIHFSAYICRPKLGLWERMILTLIYIVQYIANIVLFTPYEKTT